MVGESFLFFKLVILLRLKKLLKLSYILFKNVFNIYSERNIAYRALVSLIVG